MSSFKAFNISSIAMQQNSRAIERISSNISHTTTTGYKQSEILFKDQVANAPGPGVFSKLQQPAGANIFDRHHVTRKGSFKPTNDSFNGAIAGRGFFVTNSALNKSAEYRYTAAGEFTRQVVNPRNNEEAYLADASGNFILGWSYDTTSGTFNINKTLDAIEPIRLDNVASTVASQRQTSTVRTAINVSPVNPVGTTHLYSVPVYDGTGTADQISDTHALNFSLTKVSTNNWDLNLTVQNGTITSPTTPTRVTFAGNGLLTSPLTPIPISAQYTSPENLTHNFTLDLTGSTEFTPFDSKESFNVRTIEQDGFEPSTVSTFTIGDNGIVNARLRNGRIIPTAKIAYADFRNANSLERRNDTQFAAGNNTSDVEILEFGVDTRGRYLSGTIEESNVQLTSEILDLIGTQRSYSSISSALKAANEMIQTATNLK